MRALRYIWFIPLFLSSCFQEDEMVPPYEPGDLQTGTAGMGPYYGQQVYYDLTGNMAVDSNRVSAWDLSFESSTGGWEIRLNTSMFMYAGNSHDTTFSTTLAPASLDMKFDASGGDPDSTAIGEWTVETDEGTFSRKQVYLIDMGSDELGVARGFLKVQFDISGEDYLVRYGAPGDQQGNTIRIIRDPSARVIHFSFEDGPVELEPPADTWTLLFTRYTTMLVTNEGENYPYIVAGALLNSSGVTAVRDTVHAFEDLALADTAGMVLQTRADVIGYDWKEYDFDGGFYTIVPGKHYVIRNHDGYYYKLRFINYYNTTGEKGYPSFEFARL